MVLRPRSLDEVFDLALAYLRTFFRDLRPLILVSGMIPVTFGLASGGTMHLLGGTEVEVGLSAFLGLVLMGAVLESSTTLFVGRHLFENPTSLRAAAAASLKNALRPLIRTSLKWGPVAAFVLAVNAEQEVMVALMGLLWLMGFGLGALLTARGLHHSEVRLLEHLRGLRARRRSVVLSEARAGRNMAFMVQAGVLRLLFVVSALGASEVVFGFLLQFKGTSTVLTPIAGALGFGLAGPFIVLARLFDYVDARTRLEGWDIQVRFQDIAHRSQGPEEWTV